MKEKIEREWNALYVRHKAVVCLGTISIFESDRQAKMRNLDIQCDAVSLPSRELSGFNFWNALSNKNCDGAVVVDRGKDSCDLVLCELKSSFSTQELWDAKVQIVDSLIKFKILLSTLPSSDVIKNAYGIVVSIQPTTEKLQWIKSMSMLPREKWGEHTCGLTLFMDGKMRSRIANSNWSSQVCPREVLLYYYSCEGPTLIISLPE